MTGTSVLGLKCTDGVVLAADKLGSYGSMARFRFVLYSVLLSIYVVLWQDLGLYYTLSYCQYIWFYGKI